MSEWEEIVSKAGVWETYEEDDGSITRMMIEIVDEKERSYKMTYVESDGTTTVLEGWQVDEKPTEEDTAELRAINERLRRNEINANTRNG